MDELTSTEFRRRYATLTSPTVVTVNGHRIGVWRPFGHEARATEAVVDFARQQEDRVFEHSAAAIRAAETEEEYWRIIGLPDRYDTQPVRAVPKVK